MKRRIPTRIFSLFLAFVLLVSSCPVAFASESVDVTEPVEVTEPAQTEAAETTAAAEETEPAQTESSEPAVQTEATGATVPAEETEPSQVTEPAEETIPQETASQETVPQETTLGETTPEETVPEETEVQEESIALTGMPESYVVSEEALADKQTQIDIQFLGSLEALTAGEDYIADEILAVAESEEEAALIAAAFNGELVEYFDGFALIRLLECTVPEAVAASLDLTRNLPVVSPNYIYEYDFEEEEPSAGEFKELLPEKMSWQTWVQENMTAPDTYLKYPANSTYQYMHDTVDTYAAWGVTTGESWVKVALIDSGVYTGHEDLNTIVEVSNSYDYGNGDYNGHGTHLAGIIGASMDNSVGGAGIAPGVTIYSYRTVNDSYPTPTSSQRIKGINWAINNSVHIINLSISDFVYSASEQTAIKRAVAAGITVVAAAGNNGSNTRLFPAAMDGVIAVAATDRNGRRAHYSNYGAWVDISAPGDKITSTSSSGGYSVSSGTSQAAAVVTGVAALYTSAIGERVDPATLEKVMKKAATKVSDSGMGAGIVNAANMLDDKPDAPYLVVHDEDGYVYKSGSTVPCESYIGFWESEESYYNGTEGDQRGRLVVTFDGKTPSVKNGVVVNGTVIDDFVGYSLSGYAGTTVTIKAAFVSGMGIMGKVATVKVKVAESTNISDISIGGSSKLISGKSCTYTATVYPVDTADQDVTWEIFHWSNSAVRDTVKIDAKTGKLTTKAGSTGYVYIRVRSLVDPNMTSAKRVDIVNITPVYKITLNYSGLKNPYTLVGMSGQIKVSSMVDKYGYEIDPTISGLRWTSSNPKVLYVDNYGYFQALSKGKATITCLSLDGSGKSAKVTLEVKQPVEDIVVTGNASIAPGSSATFKATVYPSNANNKKVTWVLSGAPTGVTINASTGKVSVASYVSSGSYFYVRAYAKDRPVVTDNPYVSYLVYVYPKCTAVNIGVGSYNVGSAGGVTLNSKGYVKTVNLFSVNLPDTSAAENTITLSGYRTGPSGKTYVDWTSSNPSVVSVDGGKLTAHKAGTATITLKALDGSGKKATCTVKVTNPVSSMAIKTGAALMTDDTPYLVYGKSVKNTVSFADTYGTPSNKKVVWSFKAIEYDADGNYVNNWTNHFASSKLITVKNGTLSVKSGARKYISGELKIWVYADATDGTGVYAEQIYYAIPPTTRLYFNGNYTIVEAYQHNTERGVAFYCDQYNLYDNPYNNGFTATSSNPKVVSVSEITPTDIPGKYIIWFYVHDVAGSAKITVKTNDGSNKSSSFTVKVR